MAALDIGANWHVVLRNESGNHKSKTTLRNLRNKSANALLLCESLVGLEALSDIACVMDTDTE